MQAAMVSNHIASSPQRALHAEENGGRVKFEPIILLASFERLKKKLKKRTFFCAKNFFLGGLKEHLNKIFFKRGVIVMGVFIAFLNPNLFFFCHNADILIITKSSNWNQERSQV